MCQVGKDFRWSFSKLEAYSHCPMMFKLVYLDKVEQDENGFADYGTLCHSVLEGWAKGEIPEFAMAEEFESRFDDEVKSPFPPFPKGLVSKYFDQGLNYFENFNGFGDQYEILSAETKFYLTIEGYNFVGIADLVLQDKNTGDITIIDHKSKSKSTMKKDLPTFRKQLYTYAAWVKEKFGKYPKYMKFNLFREQDEVVFEFDEQEFHDTMKWVVDTIHKIEAEPDWKVCSSSYFCRFVCSSFSACPARDAILYDSKPKGKK